MIERFAARVSGLASGLALVVRPLSHGERAIGMRLILGRRMGGSSVELRSAVSAGGRLMTRIRCSFGIPGGQAV